MLLKSLRPIMLPLFSVFRSNHLLKHMTSSSEKMYLANPILGINFDMVKNMLEQTMLIYDYAESFKLKKGMTIEEFVGNKELEETDLNDYRKCLLKELAKTSPNGEVLYFHSSEITDLQCAITKSDVNKRITIVFRGTDSFQDALFDLQILKCRIDESLCDNKNIFVHRGFYNQLINANVFDTLKDTLENTLQIHPDYQVCVTGHSLGSGVGLLQAFLLSRNCSFLQNKKLFVVDFGGPRTGNSEFSKAFYDQPNIVHLRVTNQRDIITAVPFVFFHHTKGNVLHLEKDRAFLFDEIGNQYSSYFYSLFRCFSVKDHNCESYHKNLMNNKSKISDLLEHTHAINNPVVSESE